MRQLQHLIERLVILAPTGRIDGEAVGEALAESDTVSLKDTERDQILKVLEATGNNRSRAAKVLGIARKTLYRRLERMGLQ